jgi:hypothetical protein
MTMIMKDISCTINRQSFQGLGQLASTVAGTCYISIRPRHRTHAHYAADFMARSSNDNTAFQPTELANFLQDDIHYLYVTSAELKTNMYNIKDGNERL